MQILLWFLGPIGRYVLIAIAVAGSWLWIKVHYENIGYAKAIHAIAAQDERAINAAQEARKTVKACRDSGHSWSVETGECQ